MNDLLREVEAHVRAVARDRAPASICFHDIAHFQQVVAHAEQLAAAAALSADDRAALVIAAWSHDLGYVDGPEGHEERSAQLIGTFLEQHGADPQLIARVRSLVLVTRTGSTPTDLLEQLMKDADMGHLGSVGYPERLGLLRREREALTGVPIKRKAWIAENITFLDRYRFHSDIARALWDTQRMLNLNALKAMSAEKDRPAESPVPTTADELARKAEKKAKKEKRQKVRETERGVETLFRVTLNNHTRLSQIADNKANIMLTVNALMISLLISGPMTRVDKHPEYIPALTIVLVTCALSIITATLATRPKITAGRSTAQQMKDKTANLLFFGNFHDMPLDEYQKGMNEVMADRDYLYGSMTRDLHALGSVLHRKYKYLRITYTIFMFGVTSTVLLIVGSMLADVMPWLL